MPFVNESNYQYGVLATRARQSLENGGDDPPQDLHSLTRTELIALIQAERNASTPSVSTIWGEHISKDALVASYERRLAESEQQNRQLQATILDLREELSSLSTSMMSRNDGVRQFTRAAAPPAPDLPSRSSKRPSTAPGPKAASMFKRAATSHSSDSPSQHSNFTVSTSATSLSNEPEKQIIMHLQTLNNAIISTASKFSSCLEYNDHLISVPDRRSITLIHQAMHRSTWVVGERVASELASRPMPKDALSDNVGPPPLLAQMVFEIVCAKWAAFVLGYVDVELARSVTGAEAHHWYQTVHNLRFMAPNTTNENWATSITNCVRDITYISGWAFRTTNRELISLTPFIRAIQTLRRALDELAAASKMGVAPPEVQLIPPGTPFNPSQNAMTDGFVIAKRSFFMRRKSSSGDIVLGTTGLGLKRATDEAAFPLFAPRVALEKAFMDAFSKSSFVESPKTKVRVGGSRTSMMPSLKAKGEPKSPVR